MMEPAWVWQTSMRVMRLLGCACMLGSPSKCSCTRTCTLLSASCNHDSSRISARLSRAAGHSLLAAIPQN